jgi:hypothetical protein
MSAVTLAAICAAPAAAAAPTYATKPAHYRSVARFAVSYEGDGAFRTVYHSEPPNQGGNADTNDADDSSAQHWRLTFRKPLVVPRCGTARHHHRDHCARVAGLSGATGATGVSGSISHRHVDGLYADQNGSETCQLSAGTPTGAVLPVSVGIRYSARSHAFSITAHIPVGDALLALPSACPGQGDSLDGLYDNYFTPGFSFAAGYGPERWFESATVVVPATRIHRSAAIRVPLAATAAGTPPRDCAVEHPSYERCSTGGSWNGVLRLTAKR